VFNGVWPSWHSLFAAPTAPAQTPTKVGIINVQGAILATKDGEKARDAIRVRFEPRAKDMETRMADVNRLKDQFSKGANTMSADAREKLSREIDDKQRKYQWTPKICRMNCSRRSRNWSTKSASG